MFISKKNSTIFLFTLLSLLVTFMGDFVTAAPIGSIDDDSATIMCKLDTPFVINHALIKVVYH